MRLQLAAFMSILGSATALVTSRMADSPGAEPASVGLTWASPPLCSLVPWPETQKSDEVALLARARSDTVLAGAGATRYRLGQGHWGFARHDRAVYGQLVLVDSLAGDLAARLESELRERGSREVVIVPWDYDPACETTLWARSFRWVEEGGLGVYLVTLRAREHWADGRPTFDALAADLDPYPSGLLYQFRLEAGRDRARRLAAPAAEEAPLSAVEFFDLYRALPAEAEFRRDRARALERFERWLRTRYGWEQRPPVGEILEQLRARAGSTY